MPCVWESQVAAIIGSLGGLPDATMAHDVRPGPSSKQTFPDRMAYLLIWVALFSILPFGVVSSEGQRDKQHIRRSYQACNSIGWKLCLFIPDRCRCTLDARASLRIYFDLLLLTHAHSPAYHLHFSFLRLSSLPSFLNSPSTTRPTYLPPPALARRLPKQH